ncbi:MAG TPA: hypothetical protein VMR70_10840 [Flavisolibacter sp.]|nr:hypothetical protein [Flavisolibacter sp.]
MQLNLAINGQSLATLPVDPKRWKDPQYLQALCRLLAIKNRALISSLKKKPTYFIEVPSRMKRSRQFPELAFPLAGQLN